MKQNHEHLSPSTSNSKLAVAKMRAYFSSYDDIVMRVQPFGMILSLTPNALSKSALGTGCRWERLNADWYYSPELNPIEPVWSWLRQCCLANQCFNDYDDIVSTVCAAWDLFQTSAKRVTKVCSREWLSMNS